MMTLIIRLLLITFLVTLTACADLQTIERRTTLPLSTDSEPHDGVAIHLDAQQRLVMFHLNKYCAEPSPDALAAYAASLGFGASAASRNAASLAQGMQSSAGSIGLRTQSITLMRDALYRMCEAASNGSLNSIEVAKLLHQSQDLTAVILAVEQLTGAVAANQIILGGTTSSDATASLISNQQALDSVRKSEAGKKKDLEDATTAQQAADKVVTDKQAALQSAQDKLNQLKPTDPSYDSVTKERNQNKAELDQALAAQKKSSELCDLRKKIYDDAVTLRQQVETQKDSALANANAATSTSGQFSIPVQRVALDKGATEAIAISVKEMVQSVLNKDYSADVCMSYLTGSEGKEQTVKDTCIDIWKAKRAAANEYLRQIEQQSYAPDEFTQALQVALKNNEPKDIKTKLADWLSNHKLYISQTLFLYGAGYARDRELAVMTLIPKTDTPKVETPKSDTPPREVPKAKAKKAKTDSKP